MSGTGQFDASEKICTIPRKEKEMLKTHYNLVFLYNHKIRVKYFSY